MNAKVLHGIPINNLVAHSTLMPSCNWHLLCTLLMMGVVLAITSGCNNSARSPHVKQAAPAQSPLEITLPHSASAALTTTLWQNQQILLNHALKHLPTLTAAIQKLLDQPSSQHLKSAQILWQSFALNLEKLSILGAFATNQSQQNTANWQVLSDTYQRIMAWPSELGFLDNNGTHGNTGLVFTLDIAITPDSLNAIHHLTHQQEGVFGLYPLGLMLEGAYSPRQASQLLPITTFNQQHKQQKLKNLEEHPQNRRRALIALQLQELAKNVNAFQALIKRHDNSSALNAFNQYLPSQQQLYLLMAAQQLTSLQLQELTHYSDLPSWQHQWQYQRLQAQFTGLEQWLTQLGNHQEAAVCHDILNTLKQLISTKHLNASKDKSPPKHIITPNAQQISAITQQISAITQQSNHSHNQLKEQLAGLTVALKRAINISASNATK